MAEQVRSWPVEQVLPLLRKVDLFEGLPEEDLRTIASIVQGESFPAGEVLFEEGEPGDQFFIVFRGAVEILKDKPGGAREKLAVRRPGEAFGEMALLNDAPRSATARAVQDTQVMVVSRKDFQGILGGDSLALRMMRLLSKALRALGVRFAASERAAVASGDPAAAGAGHVSRLVQRGLLPRNAPRVEGYDIAAGTTTEDAGEGDTVWDWLPLQDGRTALLAYDVQGDGLPASHYLMASRTLLRALAAEYGDLKEILPRANAALSHSAVVGVDQFVECGIVVPDADGIEWSSAGRVPAGVIRRDGTFEELSSHGPPLGMMEGFRYASQRIPMGPGDVFIVLSQASVGLFRGAADLVAQVHGKTAGEVVATLHRAIRRAQSERPQETSVIFVRKH